MKSKRESEGEGDKGGERKRETGKEKIIRKTEIGRDGKRGNLKAQLSTQIKKCCSTLHLFANAAFVVTVSSRRR